MTCNFDIIVHNYEFLRCKFAIARKGTAKETSSLNSSQIHLFRAFHNTERFKAALPKIIMIIISSWLSDSLILQIGAMTIQPIKPLHLLYYCPPLYCMHMDTVWMYVSSFMYWTKMINATLLFYFFCFGTFFLALFHFSWAELKDLRLFLCTKNTYLSQILFTNLSKSVLVSPSYLPR